LIEFCVFLPLLVLLVFATLELARAYVVQQHLQEAARVGARAGTVRNSTAADVQSAIQTYLSSTEVGSNFTLSVSGVDPSADFDTMVTVSVSYNLQLFTNVLITAVGGLTIPLSASVTMRHQ
jgi:Flp pilus assembly protein TadG